MSYNDEDTDGDRERIDTGVGARKGSGLADTVTSHGAKLKVSSPRSTSSYATADSSSSALGRFSRPQSCGVHVNNDTGHTLGEVIEFARKFLAVGNLSTLVDVVERHEVEEGDTARALARSPKQRWQRYRYRPTSSVGGGGREGDVISRQKAP